MLFSMSYMIKYPDCIDIVIMQIIRILSISDSALMRLQSGSVCLLWRTMNQKEFPICRPMTDADLDDVLVIEQASFRTPWRREHFAHEIKARYSYPFVAVLDKAVVGFVCVMSLFEEAQILDIAVAPDQRGRGIARALMELATSLAREKGAEVMALEVRASNAAAIALYERLGFVRTGVRVAYYEDTEDAVLMEKNIKETILCSLQP